MRMTEFMANYTKPEHSAVVWDALIHAISSAHESRPANSMVRISIYILCMLIFHAGRA